MPKKEVKEGQDEVLFYDEVNLPDLEDPAVKKTMSDILALLWMVSLKRHASENSLCRKKIKVDVYQCDNQSPCKGGSYTNLDEKTDGIHNLCTKSHVGGEDDQVEDNNSKKQGKGSSDDLCKNSDGDAETIEKQVDGVDHKKVKVVKLVTRLRMRKSKTSK